MRVVVIGAGPAGLLVGTALTRRGHQVLALDRDCSAAPDGPWRRRGVMQFHHAHGFRSQVVDALREHWPEALAAWTARGAEPIILDLPGRGATVVGMRSRRETFERALRDALPAVPQLTLREAHVDAVTSSGGRATGVRLGDGTEVEADLVINASGRSGRAAEAVRPSPTLSGVCGMAYVDRQYQLLPGAEPGPSDNPVAWQSDFDGYQTILFQHERGHFSVLLVRPTADAALKELRHRAAFDAACRAIPGLADWTDPARSRPLTDVLPGGQLRNSYRGQRGPDGRLTLAGLVSVGDAVATTTPTFGRGVATTYLQVGALLRQLDDDPDLTTLGEAFDDWCEANMRPWVTDHVHMDDDVVRRWQGGDVDVSRPLPSDLILAAAEVDPRIGRSIGGYLTMTALPSCLDPVEPLARAVYERGWRRAYSPGPCRDELVDIIHHALAA